MCPSEVVFCSGRTALCSRRLQTPHLPPKRNLAFALYRLPFQRQCLTACLDGYLACALTLVSEEALLERAEHSLQVLSAAGERGSPTLPCPGQSCRSRRLLKRNNMAFNGKYWLLGVDSTTAKLAI